MTDSWNPEPLEPWEATLPPELRKQLQNAKVQERLASLTDEVLIPNELAAVFCGMSGATMKRMRQEKTGPIYRQAPTVKGTTARNQKVMYPMGELKIWRREHLTKGTAHAAQLRGTVKLSDFASLTDIQPFWRASGRLDTILGHALFLSAPFEALQAMAELEWLDWGDALSLPWTSGGRRELFEPLYVHNLNRALSRTAAGAEATALLAATDELSHG